MKRPLIGVVLGGRHERNFLEVERKHPSNRSSFKRRIFFEDCFGAPSTVHRLQYRGAWLRRSRRTIRTSEVL